ncbi:MAG: hypothetical protein ACE5KM_09325 [Planctomycetaceae bacterium]
MRCFTLTATAIVLAVVIGQNVAAAQKNAQAPRAIQVQVAPIQIQVAPGQRAIQIQVQPGLPQAVPLGRPAIGNYYGSDALSLLLNPKVQAELKLDGDLKEEVREAIQDVGRARQEDYRKARTAKPKERAKAYRAVQRKYVANSRKKAREILEPKQFKRLQEILVQMQGLRAFQNVDIQKRLKITDAQKKKFVEVQKAAITKQRKLAQDVRANGRFDYKKYREGYQKLQNEQEKKTLAVLTKAQREQFTKMKGKKFDMGNRVVVPGFLGPPVRPGFPARRPIQIQIETRPLKPDAPKREK